MRARRLDSRARSEATRLVGDAREALLRHPHLRDAEIGLEAATAAMERALDAGDAGAVKHLLPAFDELVDEHARRPAKSLVRDYAEAIGGALILAFALRTMVLAAFKIPSSSMYPTLEINDHIFINKFVYGLHVPFTATRRVEWRTPARGEVIVFIQPCEPDRDYIKRVIATADQTVEVRCNVVYVDGQPVEHQLINGGACQYEDYDEYDADRRWYAKRCSEYVERVAGHAYHTFHDAGRPGRDAQLARDGTLAAPDGKDFPRLDGARLPPSCTTQASGEPFVAPNQRPGKLVETRQGAGVCEPQLAYVVPAGHVFVMGDNRSNSNDSRYWGSVPIENIRGKALVIWLSYRDWTLAFWRGIRYGRMGNLVE